MSHTAFVFIRHGEALHHNTDKDRPLSAKGKSQAIARAQLLKNTPFDLVITSSALRAKQTAQTIMDALNISLLTIELDHLYQPEAPSDRTHVNLLLETLSSKPLSTYISHDKHQAWERYSHDAYNALKNAIDKSTQRILIVAHGNIINAVGLRLNPLATRLCDLYFNYCEGFEIHREQLTILQNTL